jgi:hypothetical protein
MAIQLFYDERDRVLASHGDRRLKWLYESGARPIAEATAHDEGFLFTGVRPMDDYRSLVGRLPLVRDRPEEREPLLQLDTVLQALEGSGIPTPRTWSIGIDDPVPGGLTYPLFVRTVKTSWKLGGNVSKVRNERELVAEMEALRNKIEWDATILAREWVELAPAGAGVYGKIPQEVRVWIVDGLPSAWSFHHLAAIAAPAGFPPKAKDLETLRGWATAVGKRFRSRLVCADFAKRTRGGWILIEAGPGSAAGTAHEAVFKAMAGRLAGQRTRDFRDSVGGIWRS